MTASPIDVPPTGPEAIPAAPPAKHGWLNFVDRFRAAAGLFHRL